ncbi:MAG: DMT family protein [Saprospiraceae bacterium]|nr:DMT family protein [Saprospiraceae bacterium]
MSGFYTVLLLFLSNLFMTLAWYGHLKFQNWTWFQKQGLFVFVLVSWGIAFFEYCLQIPSNKYGFRGNGGPFTLVQLKVIQEVLSLSTFAIFSFIFFKDEGLRWNHLLAGILIIIAVYLVFRK